MHTIDLFRKALLAFNDSAALERLRAQAPQVRAALDEQDFVLEDAEAAALEQHPGWLARVYEALGEADADADASDAELDQQQVAAILANEQEAMADAWAALLDKLDEMAAPAVAPQWEEPLRAAGPPAPPLIAYLRTQPSFRQGDIAGERLVQYGLTPAMLFEALRGMELLFNRALRRPASQAAAAEAVAGVDDISVSDGASSVVVGAALLTAQLAGTLDLAEGMAVPLGKSLRCMLQVSPLLVEGYCQVTANAFIRLPNRARQEGVLTPERLVQRWCASGREVIAVQTGELAGRY